MPMSGYRSTRRFEVVAESRRRWSRAEKLAIVAEASGAANVAAVARRHGISPSLLFRWKKKLGASAEGRPAGPAFLPVVVPPAASSRDAPEPMGAIEIDLRNGRRVRANVSVDPAALKRIDELLRIGVGFERTIRWSVSCARSDGAPVSSVHSRTASQH